MKPAKALRITILLTALALCAAQAQVPAILNYQGRVTVGGTNLTTNGAQFKFALVNSNGTAVYWNNSGTTTTNEPSNAVTVAVSQGLYSTLLGDSSLSNMASLPSGVFTNPNVNLRVWFSAGGTNPFVRLTPDQRIGSSGYALRAAVADTATVTNVSGDLAVTGVLSAGRLVGGSNTDASGAFSVVVGGSGNQATNTGSVIVGGQDNRAFGLFSFIGAGTNNEAAATYSTIAGGIANAVSNSAVGGTIGGGQENAIIGEYATVGGGFRNQALGVSSVIGGGDENMASGTLATVPGGANNVATNYAFAAGRRAKATNEGAFVWADSQDADFGSKTNNQFLIRAAGGMGINTNNPGTNALSVAGSASVSGNLNVGSINGRTNFSSYATTFSFVQNNGSSGQILSFGNTTVATFVQRPGVAITSCSVVFNQTGSSSFPASVNFVDVTGLSTSAPATNGVLPGGAQNFNTGAITNTWLAYELTGVNIPSPAVSPRIVQIVINNGGGGSSQLILNSITVGFTPN